MRCEEVSSINANISGGDPAVPDCDEMAAFPTTALIPYFDANCIQNFRKSFLTCQSIFFLNQPNIEISGGM